MATTKEYVEYVCEQIVGVGDVRFRKMFGEYMIYVNDKPILLLCDNIVFVKMHNSIKELMHDSDTGVPYQGAKEHYILDTDNIQKARDVIHTLEPHLLVPKPKKKKTINAS